MKVAIQYADGLYSFVRLDFLGDCEVAPGEVYDVDPLVVECWSAIARLQAELQKQLRGVVNGDK